MQYQARVPTHIVDGVDCQRQIWCWRLLRSLMEFIIPSCNHSYLQQQHQEEEDQEKEELHSFKNHSSFPKTIIIPTTTTITGTFFGYRHGKLSFCIQTNSKTTAPILLLTLAVPTALLAKEMQSGLLRIALKCHSDPTKHAHGSSSLLSMPFWTMYFNARKAGFAIKRRPSQADLDVLRLMRTIHSGTGIINREAVSCNNELMYLRANFKRVSGLSDSESFHLINPDGRAGQELSIFFLHSR
ncbi:protein MIZU-KUSSEI 1-like [Magnolia sinica]|uniref:protein MIZU-KUSSEI 1-like n=1 Tax=Magnolia sinica TaxID=86752 RepID=UPI002658528A|nr:protein MIZU-KUSSEI 1-like [Magnolia sinica]